MKIILSTQRRVLKLAVKMYETKFTVVLLDPWAISLQFYSEREPTRVSFPQAVSNTTADRIF